MFTKFIIPEPFMSTKDIFCLTAQRTVDAYRKISLNTVEMNVPKVPPRHTVDVRMIPDHEKQLVEVRFWYKGELTGVQIFKEQDLPLVQF